MCLTVKQKRELTGFANLKKLYAFTFSDKNDRIH